MKQYYFWIGLGAIILTACEGKLSDKQRKEMREAQKQQEIKIVTDAQIMEAALAHGKMVLASIENSGKNAAQKTDSIGKATKSIVRWLEPSSTNARLIENQLIEAYLVSAATGSSPENIQETENDSLVYTKPVIREMPDGSVTVKGMWSIWFSKKQIVASIE
jgi:hypothetical protein